MSDVLLINPRPHSWYTDEMRKIISSPPLGILYIAAYLREKGYSVSVIDLVVKKLSLEEFKEFVRGENPTVAGISSTTESINSTIKICEIIKEIDSDCLTVLGGPHPTFQYENLVKLRQVDFVVRHEGEITMHELMEAISNDTGFSHIKGLTWKDNGKVIVNVEREFIKEPSSLPFPARDLIDLKEYSEPGAIVTSRGCPNMCVFCSAGSMSGGYYRLRDPEEVLKEIRHLYNDYGVKRFFIVDNTFTAARKRAEKICNLIIHSGMDITFACESRVDIITPRFLRLLKEAGCISVQYGIESGSNRILRSVKKGITVEKIRRAVKWATDLGIHVKGSFIVGLPADNEKTIKKTFHFVRELQQKYGVEMYPSINVPFPGTEEYEKKEDYGIKIDSENWDDFILSNAIIDTKNLSKDKIRDYYFRIAEETMSFNQRIRAKREFYENA